MNLRKLNLNLLLVFDHIWSTRNLTQVASQLNMTQPGVSTSLNRLRELFNDPLFKWNGNTMTPTPRARQLAPRIHALLVEMDQLIGGSSNDIAETKREFVLASVDWVFADSGNGLLLRVRNQAPGIKLRFEHLSLAMFEQQERYGAATVFCLFRVHRVMMGNCQPRCIELDFRQRGEFVDAGTLANGKVIFGGHSDERVLVDLPFFQRGVEQSDIGGNDQINTVAFLLFKHCQGEMLKAQFYAAA